MLGGDALGADPTYLLYLPFRSHGGIRAPSIDPTPGSRTLPRPRRAGIDPQASSVQVWHFPGQKLRLGGDALGAGPTYLLYLPSRSRGGLRRIDFGAYAALTDPASRLSRLLPDREVDETPHGFRSGAASCVVAQTGGWAAPARAARSGRATGRPRPAGGIAAAWVSRRYCSSNPLPETDELLLLL